MRPLITWLVLLVVASMLVGTVWANPATPSKMPCCPDSRPNGQGCHHFCAPSAFGGNATAPRDSAVVQADLTGSDTHREPPALLPCHQRLSPVDPQPAGQLFKRIHVFLI
jgi:hypothetical protein